MELAEKFLGVNVAELCVRRFQKTPVSQRFLKIFLMHVSSPMLQASYSNLGERW